MSFLPALLGALVGGMFAMCGTWLADRRSSARELQRAVHALGSAAATWANRIRNEVGDLHATRAEGHPTALIDRASLRDAEASYVRAYTQFSSYVRLSPIWQKLENLEAARANLINTCGPLRSEEHWPELADAFQRALGEFGDAMDYFAGLSPAEARWYLTTRRRPVPPPIGVAPPKPYRGRRKRALVAALRGGKPSWFF